MSLLLSTTNVFAQQKCVVVLDAGHGGKDPGAVSAKVYEKDINLSIVKATGAILEAEGSFQVVYTRTDDTFIELSERSNIANRNEADLFVSVHTNANNSSSAYGTETFVMGVHKNDANLGVAMRENGVISLESDFNEKYEGYDPTSAESHIMFTLMQYGHQQQSLELASTIQANFVAKGRRDRGVKQAGFLVLWRNAMPSVLVEVGFVTNKEEREFITNTKGVVAMGSAIAEAVKSYWNNNNATQSATYDGVKEDTVNDDIVPVEGKDVCYAIQIRASKEPLELNKDNFGALVMLVEQRSIDGMYKYSVGELYNVEDARAMLKKIKKRVRDAFIVAYDNNGAPVKVSKK